MSNHFWVAIWVGMVLVAFVLLQIIDLIERMVCKRNNNSGIEPPDRLGSEEVWQAYYRAVACRENNKQSNTEGNE